MSKSYNDVIDFRRYTIVDIAVLQEIDLMKRLAHMPRGRRERKEYFQYQITTIQLGFARKFVHILY